MREWFTAAEIASLALSGLPQTKFRVIEKAKKGLWQSRPRNAVGGGMEYHISNLPDAAQIELVQKLSEPMNRAMAEDSEVFSEFGKPAEPAKPTLDDKKYAKVYLVSRFERFCSTHALGIVAAEKPFIDLYQHHVAARNFTQFPEWVQDALPSFSVPSLRRWRKAAEDDSLRDLAGNFGNRKGASVLKRAEDGRVSTYIAAILVSQPQLKPGHIRDMVRANFGSSLKLKDERSGQETDMPLPKIRSFERHILEWKAEHHNIHRKLTNPDGYKNTHQMALGSQSQTANGLNEVWEIDASPVDALCVDGRYTIYAIIDVWSRRSLFLVTKTPRTEASLQMIRRAIMEWGIPKVIKTDNGSDFKSKRFVAALADLRIQQKLCPPYTPEGKPHVERVIKNIQHNLMPILPGYVGHDVEERSQIEARKTFAQKLGVDDRAAFMVSMDHIKLQGLIDQWALDRYAHQVHRGLGKMTPFEKAATWTGEVRKVGSDRALDLLLAPIAGSDGYRTITKKALRINNRQYYGPGIELHVGSRVLVRHDPEDMSKVYVFHEDGQFLCEAHDYEALPHEDQVAAAQYAKASQRADIREPVMALRREAKDLTPEVISKTILDLATADRSNLIELPRTGTTYQTPALSEAEKAMGSAPPVFSQYRPQPLVLPEEKQEQSDDDRWWERRNKILVVKLDQQDIPERDAKWLAWYESTPNFKSRNDLLELMGSGGEDV